MNLVSIITVTKNRRVLLEKLIKSTLNYDYPTIEHIVIDGLSSDGTPELLKQYEDKYNLRWVSEKDKNQTEGVNKGLKMATGEFIIINHDDDYWLENGITRLMEEFFKNSELDLVYGDSYSVFPDGRKEVVRYRYYTHNEMIDGGYQIPQHGSILKRFWLDKVGYLDENINHVAEYEFFLKMIENGAKYKHIPEIVCVGLQHAQKESWVCWNHSWDETLMVNRRHGGRFFSKFTLIYWKNRYFLKPAKFIKKYFPWLFKLINKIFKPPVYH